MQIEMLTLAAGPDAVRAPGVIYEVSRKEAAALIEGGYARAAGGSETATVEAPEDETAETLEDESFEAPETAARPRSRRR